LRARTQWGVGCGCFVLVVVFIAVLGTLIGGLQQGSEDAEQASSTDTEETPEEETVEEVAKTEEVAEKTSQSYEEQAERKKPIRPEPRTPEERVRANVEDMPAFEKLEPDDPQQVWVDFYDDNGCLDVLVKYRDTGVTFGLGTQADWTEAQMWQIYKAIHADRATHEAVCDVSVEAYGDITDDYGQVTEEMLFETTLSRDVAARVNWSNAASANYTELWQVDYVHPQLEAERARENVGQAVDCLQEGGLFDLDWLECP
jgi:hypothetical protein